MSVNSASVFGMGNGTVRPKPNTPTTSMLTSGLLPQQGARSGGLGTPVAQGVGVLPSASTAGLNPYANAKLPTGPAAYGAARGLFGNGFGENSYITDPSNVFPATPYTPMSDLFMAPQLRNKFQQAPTSTTRNTTVASSKFHHYTAIVNIDAKAMDSSLHRSLSTQVLRTTNRFNGKHVIIRRLVNAPATPAECAAIFDRLRHFRHPNLVPLHSITPTTEFVLGSNDTIVEYRMIKRAKSMQEAFFTPKSLIASTLGASPLNSGVALTALASGSTASAVESTSLPCEITEGLLWSIACQLIGLIRTFHDVQVPLRGLHLSKLMWLDVVGRIYFTGLGLMDIAEPNPNIPLEVLLKLDIQQLGLILLQLAAQSAGISIAEGRAVLQRCHRYSATFMNLVAVCLDASVDINSLCRGLGERLSIEVGHQAGNTDFLLSECSKEVHNGRLMRLMVKLSFVLESQEATEYADASDRFTLKLFNQYVFNQVDEHNRPRVDWGHVYHSLNKLDCGSEDLVQLISQDSSTILVVSYRDVRTMLDKAFEQLQQPGHDLSFAGLQALQAQQQPTSTPPTISQPQL